MKIIETKIKGLYLIKPEVFRDERGFFLENYSFKKFSEAGIGTTFVQDNHSFSANKGVIRGLHFQLPPFTQTKLVRVTRGSVFDVAVDLRKNSKTYGKWFSVELSADNFKMLYIPKGFAHGFCTLEPNTEFMYKNDEFYSPAHESGIIWNDPNIAIEWPIENFSPILSKKDSSAMFFKDFNSPF